MNIQNINTDTYIIVDVNETSKSITFSKVYKNKPKAIIANLSDKPTYVIAGIGSAPTAVYPTSASIPVLGKVVPAGAVLTYELSEQHTHISAIQKATDGVGDLVISIGEYG